MNIKPSTIKYISIAIFVFIASLILFSLYYLVKDSNNEQTTTIIERQDQELENKQKIEEIKSIFRKYCSINLNHKTENSDLFNSMCRKLDEVKINEDNQSYTINKEKIYLCLTDKENKFYSNNMLTYVLLHEFAHTLCKSVGHTPEFHAIFEKLLKEAIVRGLYDPSIPVDPEYCKHNSKKK